MRALLVGARRARQGTGPFLAAALQEAGAEVCAIVGTRDASVAAAREDLLNRLQIDCTGYTELAAALAAEQPDAVALCSPWRFHAEQLRQVAAAGCHCLVEKPLAWPASTGAVDDLIRPFEDNDRVLQMVTQWPLTLPAFEAVHGTRAKPATSFEMGLSPISIGADMITDAAPHFISMLMALVGPGYFAGVTVESEPGARPERLTLSGDYGHGGGTCRATLSLITCPEPPRPAWYAINGVRADREIELPGYQQYLAADGKRAALPDPLMEVAARFVTAVAAGHTDGDSLRTAHLNLLELAEAMPADLA